MRTVTATEASRRFSDLLDAIEAGETATVTRGNRPVAELRPARRRTGRDRRAMLDEAGAPPPDDAFVREITEAVAALTEPTTSWWQRTPLRPSGRS